jgi:hypothetical protein
MLRNVAGKKELDFLQAYSHSKSGEAAGHVLFEGVRDHVNFNARESDLPGAENIVVSLLADRGLEAASLQFLSLHGFNPLAGGDGSGQIGLEALLVLSEYLSCDYLSGNTLQAEKNLKHYRTQPAKAFEIIKWFLSFPLDFAVPAKQGISETVEEWFCSEGNFAFFEKRFFDAALLETACRMIGYAKKQKDYQTLEPFYSALKSRLLAAEVMSLGGAPFTAVNKEDKEGELLYIGDLVLYFESGPLIVERDTLPVIDPIKVLQEAPGVLLPHSYSDQIVGRKLKDIVIIREKSVKGGGDPETVPMKIQFLFENGWSLVIRSLSDVSSSYSLTCRKTAGQYAEESLKISH